MATSKMPAVASSISGHVETLGTRRMSGMVSRKTRELAGFASGPRKASELATALRDGTVRPVPAAIRWPSGPSANSMNVQAASL
jgi:hypothetical protein